MLHDNFKSIFLATFFTTSLEKAILSRKVLPIKISSPSFFLCLNFRQLNEKAKDEPISHKKNDRNKLPQSLVFIAKTDQTNFR
jgi:hypothetical protein